MEPQRKGKRIYAPGITLDEWYANHGVALGVERALLVVLAAAGGVRVNG